MIPNQTFFHYRRILILATAGFFFMTVLFLTPAIGIAYFEPSSTPPSYEAGPDVSNKQLPELLNNTGPTVGPDVQRIGTLQIGRAENVVVCPTGNEPNCNNHRLLCLNPDLTNFPGASDLGTPGTPGNCISSWATPLEPRFGLPQTSDFLTLRKAAASPLASQNDSGFSTWQANPSGQVFSFITEAPVGTDGGNALRTEGLVSAYYAAQFYGTLGIGRQNFPGRLCLNDQDAAVSGGKNNNCKSSWDEVIAATQTGLLSLQDTRIVATPIITEVGQTATAGALIADSYVAGSPIGILSPFIYSCGDGICQPPAEDDTSCNYDCK